MNPISTKNILFLMLLSINLFSGFLPGTPVKTTTGYQSIDTIKSGNKLFSYTPEAGFIENKAKVAWKNKTNSCVVIHYRNTELVANADQQFYLAESEKWVAAHQLQPGDTLFSYKYGHIRIDAVEKRAFDGFTHCIQLNTIHNFCVSDDDIVVHNFGIAIDLLNPPTLAVLGVAALVAGGLWLVEYCLAQYGYHVNFLIKADGSLSFNPFKNNEVIDFNNPYTYYEHRYSQSSFYPQFRSNKSQLNNDVYYNSDLHSNHYNNFVAQNTYHDKQTAQQKPFPVSVTQLAPIKNSDGAQSSSTSSSIIHKTTTPDPEIGKRPSGSPTPEPQMPINSGGFEPSKQEKIIFTTPMPKIEKPHICIHYPIDQDLSRIILTQEVASTEFDKKDPRSIDDIVGKLIRDDKTKGKSKIYIKPGGTFDDAMKDFESLGLANIRNIPTGLAGDLLDGRTVNVRTDSSDKRATLEVYDPTNDKKIKIRYGDK